MKINPNINANLGQQDFEKKAVDSAPGSLPLPQTDQLETANAVKGFLFGDRVRSELNTDFASSASLLTGGKSVDFGLALPLDLLLAPSDVAETETRSGIFDFLGYGLVDASDDVKGWLGDAMEWLGHGIADTPEAFSDAVGAVVDASKAVGGAIADAAGAVADAGEWVGEQVYDAVSNWAESTYDGFATGAEAVADAIGDLFSW